MADPVALFGGVTDPSGVSVKIAKITPTLATQLLAQGHRNREIRPGHVSRLTKVIRDGRWKLNGESIVIDEHGEVIDGQHRLKACIQANLPITAVMVQGVAPDAYSTIDTGMKKTNADFLHMNGYRNPMLLSAAVNNLWRYENRSDRWHDALSADEQLEFMERHPDLEECVAIGRRTQEFVQPSVSGTVYYLFRQKDPVVAEEFIETIQHGLHATKSDPFYQAREIMRQNKSALTPMRGRELFWLCLKAWELKRSGSKAKLRPRAILEDGSREAWPDVI